MTACGVKPTIEQQRQEALMELQALNQEMLAHDLVELRIERRIAMNVAGALAALQQGELHACEELLRETEGQFKEWFRRDLRENLGHRSQGEQVEVLKGLLSEALPWEEER